MTWAPMTWDNFLQDKIRDCSSFNVCHWESFGEFGEIIHKYDDCVVARVGNRHRKTVAHYQVPGVSNSDCFKISGMFGGNGAFETHFAITCPCNNVGFHLWPPIFLLDGVECFVCRKMATKDRIVEGVK